MDTRFAYILENTLLYQPDWMTVGIGLAVGILFLVGLRSFFLYSWGHALIRNDIKMLAKKKDTLSDLILMKDIQTELEKEIEQAMLKATFQG